MSFWFSPFPIGPKLQKLLAKEHWQHDESAEHPPCDLLLLYDAPHALARPGLSGIQSDELAASYRLLISLVRSGARAVAIPRFMRASRQRGRVGPEVNKDLVLHASLPNPSPLEAHITLALLDRKPALLDAYLDLELSSDLLGGHVDTDYLHRLWRVADSIDADRLLQQWRAPMRAAHVFAERQRKSEASLESCLTRIVELEEIRKQAVAVMEERNRLRAELETQAWALASLQEKYDTMANQLCQAHLDLESTFLNSQRGLELSRQCQVELRRAEALLLNLPSVA